VEENANISSKFGSWAKKKHFPHIDIGIAAAHICIAAEDEGLGTCIIGWFDEKKLKKILSIPPGKRALLDIVLGYPLQATRPKVRKSPEEAISYNKYR
jgi:nitroreductase